jgi:hypothetical protein
MNPETKETIKAYLAALVAAPFLYFLLVAVMTLEF